MKKILLLIVFVCISNISFAQITPWPSSGSPVAASPVQVIAGTSLATNQVTVTTAGTAVRITATPTPILSVTIKALAANTGIIYVGNSTSVSSTTGYPLSAGQSVSLDNSDLSQIWVNASANGDKIAYLTLTQ